MYLSLLTSELKNRFLDLSLILIAADGKITDTEEKILMEYCSEMNISPPENTSSPNLNELLDIISETADTKQKKIIVFELMGIALADSNYDGTEKKIIELASVYFGLENDYLEKCENIITEYLSLQNKINDIVIT